MNRPATKRRGNLLNELIRSVRLRFSDDLGDRGELAAVRLLKSQGLRILARQYTSPAGEVDIIALDGETLVFVEVKTRRGDDYGTPADAVDDEKQRRLTKLAVRFLKDHDLLDVACRFDIVSVLWPTGSDQPVVEHFAHAFEANSAADLFA